MNVKSYRDLTVWQESIVLVDQIYELTGLFPKEELYGLSNQMRRCAVSIPSNIAEGFLRGSRRDYARFVTMAYASGGELETQLEIAKRREYMGEQRFTEVSRRLTSIMKMLNSLRNALCNGPKA